VALANLNWSQYKQLIRLLGHAWSATAHKFQFQSLQWSSEPISLVVPALLAPFEASKALWKTMWQGAVTIGLINIPGVTAAEWKITDIIEYVCGNPVLLGLFAIAVDTLEIIVKADAFPVAGGHCFLLSVTFGNFGILCKCTALHFIAAVANCTDKERNLIAKVVDTNFRIIDALASQGCYFIKALGKTVNIRFMLGGDDKVLRLFTGLVPSCSNWCCFYCYWYRNLHPGVAQTTCKRSVANALLMCGNGSGGHEAAPMLRHVPWNCYVMCVLHALLAMGRVFCHWLFNWLLHLESIGCTQQVWEAAAYWLKTLHININIREKPQRGAWSVKGT
jgi:hypothetical protein